MLALIECINYSLLHSKLSPNVYLICKSSVWAGLSRKGSVGKPISLAEAAQLRPEGFTSKMTHSHGGKVSILSPGRQLGLKVGVVLGLGGSVEDSLSIQVGFSWPASAFSWPSD